MASPLTATLTMFSIQVGFPVAGILLGDKLLKSQKDKKIRYGLGITAFAFGGWLLSSHFITKYLENVDITLSAESDSEDWEEVWDDNLMEWFSKHLISPKNSDSRIIGLNYTVQAPLYDSQGFDTGATYKDFYSSYPELESMPFVYEPMNDRAGLEEIEMEVYNLWNQADGFFFIGKEPYVGARSQEAELVFYQEVEGGNGRRKPLFIYHLAQTHY